MRVATPKVAQLAGLFWIGVGAQYHHDQDHLKQLQADNRRLSTERDTAQQEAQDSAAQAAEARAQASESYDKMTQAQSKNGDLATKAKTADRVGFMRGFCIASYAYDVMVVGKTGQESEADLRQVTSVTDASLWPSCEDGINGALQVLSQYPTSPATPSAPLPAAPAVPNFVSGGILCSDGSISHAAHRQGACSWHGGISP